MYSFIKSTKNETMTRGLICKKFHERGRDFKISACSYRLSCMLIYSRGHLSTLLRSRRLSCALLGSRALWSTNMCSQRLSCALSNSRALSLTFARSQRLSCALIHSFVFLSALVRSQRLSYTLIDSCTLSLDSPAPGAHNPCVRYIDQQELTTR